MIRLPDPAPRHKPAFALTPLADVMFQLLIFFMLSTSLAPYALLPLGGAPPAGDGAAETQPNTDAASFDRPQIWHLGRNSLRVGNERGTLADAPDLVAAAQGLGVGEVLLFPSQAATAQDVATVLEALQAGRIARVRLVGRPGG